MKILYKNKKTGNVYIKLGTVIDCTNERDGVVSVLYTRDEQMFVREEKEFNDKFEKCAE